MISDFTATVPPETDQAFPMHINKFNVDRIDAAVENNAEVVDIYDSELDPAP